MSDCCSCHLRAPCSWCESLTEEEVGILDQEGADAVIRFREKLRSEAENDDGN